MIEGDLLVSSSKASRGEPAGTVQVVKRVLGSWQRIDIFLSDFVQMAVNNTETPRPVLLRNQYCRRRPWTCRRLSDAFNEHIVNLSLK